MNNYRQEIRALHHPFLKRCESILFRNWWVFLFSILCLVLYEQGVYSYRDQQVYLSSRMAVLETQRDELLTQREDLKLQINSQSDPAWIELTLIKVLGVVPTGQKKVYFEKSVID